MTGDDVGYVGIKMAVGCKNIHPHVPLIVSRVPRHTEEAFHSVISKRKRQSPQGRELGIDISQSPELTPYRRGQMVGKSILVYNTDKSSQRGNAQSDDPYDRWSQALASCESLCKKAAREVAIGTDGITLSFVMPVLVVANNALWTVDYDEKGDQGAPAPADEATLFVDRKYEALNAASTGSYRVSHLHIYTLKGLVEALRRFNSDDGKSLHEIFGFCETRTKRGI